MAEILTFRIIFEKDQAVDSLHRLDAETQKFTGHATVSFESLTSKIVSASFALNQVAEVAMRLAHAVAAPIREFSEFETRMKNVESLGVANIEELTGAVLRLGTDERIPLGFNNMAEGLYQVVSAGVDAAHQMEVLEATAKAGVAGLADTTDALNLASAVIKGYGKDWGETEDILNKAFQTVKLGQTTFPELAAAIGTVTPQAAALKIKTDELFGAFATLTGVTGSTAEVATQLRAIMSALADPTRQLSELMRQYGYDTVEAAVQSEGLAGILKILQEATGGSAAKMSELFGRVEAVTAALALTGAQYDDFIDKTREMETATGALEQAFETNADTIENHWRIVQNKFTAALIHAVETFKPLINSVLDLSAYLLSVDWKPFVVGATSAAAALTAIKVSQFITSLGGLTSVLSSVGAAFSAFSVTVNVSLASIPIVGWAAAAVSALTALGTALWLTADSEKELAEERKRNAQETINLIEHEKKRIEQAIEAGEAVEENRKKLEKLNRAMLAQQKIIADADIKIYAEEMKEAAEDLKDLSRGIYDVTTSKAVVIRGLFRQFGDDYIAMHEAVIRKMADISDKLQEHQIGLIQLTEDEIKQLEHEYSDYEKIIRYLEKAAAAQKQYNEALKRRRELSGITETGTRTVTSETHEKTVKIRTEVTIDKEKTDEILRKQKTHEIYFTQLTVEEKRAVFRKWYDERERLLRLKLEAGLIDEEKFHRERKALLSEELEFARTIYREDSREYLTVLAKKKETELELIHDKETALKKQQELLQTQYSAEIISAETYFRKKRELLEQQVQFAVEQYGTDSTNYANAVEALRALDEEYFRFKQDRIKQEIALLDAKHQVEIVSDRDYLEQRLALYDEQLRLIAEKEGENSAEYFRLLGERRDFEMNYWQYLYRQRLESLQEMLEEGLIGEEDFAAQRMSLLDALLEHARTIYGEESKIYQDLVAKKKKLTREDERNTRASLEAQQRMQEQAASFIISNWAAVARNLRAQSRTAFLISKRASQLETLIKTYEAAQKAYAAYAAWPPLAIAAAASAMAAGMARVAAIEAQSFAGGGVVQEPTLIVAGDAKRAGAPENTEFILNAPQMREILREVRTPTIVQVEMDVDTLKTAFTEALEERTFNVQVEGELRAEDIYVANLKGEQYFNKRSL